VATLRRVLGASLAKIKATVPQPVRRAAVAFAGYQMRKYAQTFGEANARKLVAAAGLLAAAPVPGAAPLGFDLIEGAYWALKGARLVSGRKSLDDVRLAEAVLAVLAEWHRHLGRELPEGYTADLARQALAMVAGGDQDEGESDGQGEGAAPPDPVRDGVRDQAGVRRPSLTVPPSPFRRKGLHPYPAKGSWFATCPRDRRGYCLPKGAAGGGQAGAAAPAPPPGAPPARPGPTKPKFVRKLARFTSPAIRRRILHGLRNEGQLAEAVGGLNLPDSEPADVVVLVTPGGEMVTNRDTVLSHLRQREDALKRLARAPGGPQSEQLREWLKGHALHFLEVKTLLTTARDGVRMSAGAVARKRRWERRYGAKFSTVIVDDRRGRKHSGSRLHFYGGVGNIRLAAAEAVAGFDGIADKLLGGEG
jgi:hypothetical protein